MKTFEQYLRENLEQGSEFKLVVKCADDDNVSFYIHPLGRDGTTFDGHSFDNNFVSEETFTEIWENIKKQLDKQ